MTLPAHISGGYLVIKLVNKINPNLGYDSSGLIIAAVVGAVFPDIDFFFFKYFKDHHNSIPHTPLFWLSAYIIVYLMGFFLKNQFIKSYSTALAIGIFVHLFLDWFNARAAGIRILYPFSEKMFSLFPINPEKGKVPTSLFPFPKKEYIEFYKFYAQNTFLLFTEISITVTGLLVWIFNKLK